MAALRDEIEAHCLMKMGRVPDLENPVGYNDKIQWLKLHDQRPEHIVCCDKWAVREHVAKTIGPDVLVPASTVWPPEFYPCVAKCTHDSGSTEFLFGPEHIARASTRLSKRMRRTYGGDKGEWAYRLFDPQVMVERMLPGEMVDFKVHCSEGRVLFVQIVTDILGKAREAVFMPDGAVTDLRTNPKFAHDKGVYPGDEALAVVSGFARRLSKGWRYVRVDFLWSEGRAWFSEMTFWPRSGIYHEPDQMAFGHLLDIDLSYKLEPVVT